jgi:hypothetical protein
MYVDCGLLGCVAVWCCKWFRTKLSPPSSEDSDTFLLNVRNYVQDHTTSQPRTPQSTSSPPWEPEISTHYCIVYSTSMRRWNFQVTVLRGISSACFSPLPFAPCSKVNTEEWNSSGWLWFFLLQLPIKDRHLKTNGYKALNLTFRFVWGDSYCW